MSRRGRDTSNNSFFDSYGEVSQPLGVLHPVNHYGYIRGEVVVKIPCNIISRDSTS